MPAFVDRALRGYLRCGVLAHGFARFRCRACRAERLVAFSCKTRNLCPSCGGRRMAAGAADLVDRVLPNVRTRQWVLSLPFWLRWRLAWDPRLSRAVLHVFLRAVFARYRSRARVRGVPGGRTGSVTVVQRFGSALNLNVHFHSLVPDGVWAEADGELAFHPMPAPSAAELERLCERVAQRVQRLLVRRGLWEEDEDGGRPTTCDEPPALADLYEASVLNRSAGSRRSPTREGSATDESTSRTATSGARSGGFDLHAGTVVGAKKRTRLEQLCRYLLRPPLGMDRLDRVPGGDVRLSLKTAWRDGTTHLRLAPVELVARLAALVPRPRTNQVLYHGVLAANAKWRPRIVPLGRGSNASRATGRPNWTWADLLRRGLDVDGAACPTVGCEGRLRFVAAVMERSAVERILRHLGLPFAPVVTAPARAPPLSFDAA